MTIEITTIAERPDLRSRIWIPDTWPEFARHDPVGRAHVGRLADLFPEFTVVAVDGAGEVVARGHSVPFALHDPQRGALPVAGWDQVLNWSLSDHYRSAPTDTVSAIDITVRADRLGQGLSGRMLDGMRRTAQALGFAELVAPVRPTGKHHEPATPIAEYAYRVREDGLPVDAWLRTHVRAGGVIDSVAPASMVITGSPAQWREWTGLPFDSDGWVEVPGALVPVRCVPEHDYAVYVEPNVWVRHALR